MRFLIPRCTAGRPPAPRRHVRAADGTVGRISLGDRASATSWSAEAGATALIEGRAGRLNPLAGDRTFIRAAIAAALGDADRAVELLRQAEYDGLRFSPDVLCSPDLAPLRGHPSFEAWRQPRTLPGSR